MSSLALTGRRRIFVDVDERFGVHLAKLTHLVHSKFKLVPVHLIMVAVRCGVVGAPGIRYQESGISKFRQKKRKSAAILLLVSGMRCEVYPHTGSPV
jgi:hypothetical protein